MPGINSLRHHHQGDEALPPSAPASSLSEFNLAKIKTRFPCPLAPDPAPLGFLFIMLSPLPKVFDS